MPDRVSPAHARHLFDVLRDHDFAWTVEALPGLMDALEFTIDTEIPGMGAIADTPWDVPDSDASLLYDRDVVKSITIRATRRYPETPAGRLASADAFALLTAAATETFGPPTAAIPDTVPRTQWRREHATTTLQNVATGVLVVVNSNDHQDFNDSIGRF